MADRSGAGRAACTRRKQFGKQVAQRGARCEYPPDDRCSSAALQPSCLGENRFGSFNEVPSQRRHQRHIPLVTCNPQHLNTVQPSTDRRRDDSVMDARTDRHPSSVIFGQKSRSCNGRRKCRKDGREDEYRGQRQRNELAPRLVLHVRGAAIPSCDAFPVASVASLEAG